jgi:hypothetical protein
MAQRFTLDSRSFEQFLAAASLLQQFQRHATQTSGPPNFAQHLLELVETQKAIESGTLDTNMAIERIVRLALRVLGGEGTAVWLFSNDEFVYRTGSGRSVAHDERLRLTVLARVAAICEPSRESFPGQRHWAKGAGDSGYYPGCVRSLLVGPIYHNQTVVGALAAFSSAFDVFDQRDAANIRLLSGLIGSAMERAVVPDVKSVAVPRQALLRIIEHIVPRLERLVQQEDSERQIQPASTAVSQSQFVPAPIFSEKTTETEPVSEEVEGISASTSSMMQSIPTQPATEAEDATLLDAFAASAEEQEPEIVRVTALREELARLSQNIAEIETRDEPAIVTPAPTTVVTPIAAAASEPEPVEAHALEEARGHEAEESAMLVRQSDAVSEAQQVGDSEEFTPLDDTAVPGIGVRAALYDDQEEAEPSHVWASIRAAAAHSVQFLRNTGASISRSFRTAGSWGASNSRQLGKRVRSKAKVGIAMPKFPTEKVSALSHQARLALSSQARNLGNQVRTGARRRVHVPNISAEKARNLAQQTSTWFRTAASGAGRGFRSASNFLPDLSHVSLENTRRHMRRAREIGASAVQNTGFRTHRFPSLRLKVHVNGRALRRSASAFAILVIMAAFLVMESGLFRSDTMAAASAHHEAQAANAASPVSAEAPVTNTAGVQPNDRPAVSRTHATTGPTSHLVITDPSIEDTVQNLTRYEVMTLRRQADSADEEAAFQLGMVYEIGYNVKQNCAKAAEWVTRSAQAGYPAAQYNLGLRYRDGDGVAVNAADAEKWLNKAAAGKYRPARVALAKLMPHER